MSTFYKNVSTLMANLSKYPPSTRAFTYKSLISLENLYPGSNLKPSTPTKCPAPEGETFNGYIPINQLQITYSKSTGPGGQNVNKVNTKVDVRFHVDSADWLSSQVKAKLSEKFKSKITSEGFMVFRSDLTRSQQMNLADCLQKIRDVVRNVEDREPKAAVESPEKFRRRLERAAQERLALKRERAQVKSDRQGPSVREIL